MVAIQAAGLLGLQIYEAVAMRREMPVLERGTSEMRTQVAELSAALEGVDRDREYMEGLARRLGFVERGEIALFYPERRP